MRRRLLVTGLAIALLVSAALALPRVSPHLPHSLETVANLPERLVAQVLPPRVPASARLAGLTGAEREAVGTLARRLTGHIVWSSNRTGNHELYLLDLGSGTVRKPHEHAIRGVLLALLPGRTSHPLHSQPARVRDPGTPRPGTCT